MKKAPLHLAATLILALGISPIASAKELFDNFYFFGDSLSDMGNNTVTDGGAPVTSPGGSTWTNDFANNFGGGSSASNNGGNDYAYAGAQTSGNNPNGTPVTINGQTNSGVTGQISTYLAGHRADPRAIYSIWAGANNIEEGFYEYVLGQLSDLSAIVLNGTADLDQAVRMLHNAGAKYIMVFNLPDLADTPLIEQYNSSTISNGVSTISQDFNQVLASKLNAEGFDVIQIDIYSLLNDVVADKAHFGFTNVTNSCVTKDSNGNITSVCSNPNQYLFWDDQHPTAAGHRAIADYAYSVVIGPTRAAILAEAPFSVMDGQNFNNEAQLYNIRTNLTKLTVGQTTTFASADYTPYSQDNQGTKGPGFDAHNTNLTWGFIHRISDSFVGGASIAHSFGHVNFGLNAGGFDMSENMASLFGGYQYNNFYADGMANYGIINDSSITRNIPIGVSQNEASGSTSGSQAGANLILGYNIINNNNLQMGPFVNADYQYVHINAYAETGSIGGIAEQFDAQTNNSLTTGLGWQIAEIININSIPVMPFAQLSYNHQWLDDERDVGAGLVSIPGSHFSIPASGAPSRNYALGTVGISTNLAKAITLSLGYNTTIFYSGAHTQNVNASLQVLL